MLQRIVVSLKNINLANRITLFRIGVVIPMLICVSFETKISTFFACIFFSLASISDFLDGYIARTQGQVTNLGKFLDPLADKLLICSVLIEMASLGWISSWIVNIIVMRELAVTALRTVAMDYGIVLSADRFGKWKTGFQIAAIIPLLLHYPYFGLPIHELGTFLLYIALFFTILSGGNYFISLYKDVCRKDGV